MFPNILNMGEFFLTHQDETKEIAGLINCSTVNLKNTQQAMKKFQQSLSEMSNSELREMIQHEILLKDEEVRLEEIQTMIEKISSNYLKKTSVSIVTQTEIAQELSLDNSFRIAHLRAELTDHLVNLDIEIQGLKIRETLIILLLIAIIGLLILFVCTKNTLI